jgi:hypothetical protein
LRDDELAKIPLKSVCYVNKTTRVKIPQIEEIKETRENSVKAA